ncbi:TYPE IV INOSITOL POLYPHOSPHATE 5-PHOSPHATASE 7-LIKE, partial [Salix viminalis]
MVGVFISVWMKMEFLTEYCISNVKVSSMACGIMGYMGNKGAVSGNMSIEGTSFCFTAAHLASGEKRGTFLPMPSGKMNTTQDLNIICITKGTYTSFATAQQGKHNAVPAQKSACF